MASLRDYRDATNPACEPARPITNENGKQRATANDQAA